MLVRRVSTVVAVGVSRLFVLSVIVFTSMVDLVAGFMEVQSVEPSRSSISLVDHELVCPPLYCRQSPSPVFLFYTGKGQDVCHPIWVVIPYFAIAP